MSAKTSPRPQSKPEIEVVASDVAAFARRAEAGRRRIVSLEEQLKNTRSDTATAMLNHQNAVNRLLQLSQILQPAL